MTAGAGGAWRGRTPLALPARWTKAVLRRALARLGGDDAERAVAPAGLRLNEYDLQLDDAAIAGGAHRDFVGGLWEEMGRLQLELLIEQGLRPHHRLLDIGCGALRAGLHFVRYLEPGHYFGTDINASLIQAGRHELRASGLTSRRPCLTVDPAFELERLGTSFDFALAQSLFTHLPTNHIERCLVNAAKVLRPGGRLFATFFEAPHRHPLAPIDRPGGVVSHLDRDPYHYHLSTFEALAAGLPFDLQNLGEWGHPRGQHMLVFARHGPEPSSRVAGG